MRWFQSSNPATGVKENYWSSRCDDHDIPVFVACGHRLCGRFYIRRMEYRAARPFLLQDHRNLRFGKRVRRFKTLGNAQRAAERDAAIRS